MSSDLPDGWQIRSLGGVSLGKGEYGANVSKADFDPALPRYVRITDISNQGTLIPTSLASISHEAAKGYCLNEGDLLFARSGATVGKSLLYQSHYGPCAFAGYLIRFRLDPAKIDPYFARNIVQSAEYWDWIATVQRAQAQPNINAQEYATLPLMLPPLDEQRRIAEVLRSVDEALHTARCVADQCEQVLRVELDGIATRLFAGNVPQVKLGQVARVKGGKRLPKGSEYSDAPTGNPYIRVTDWQDYEISAADLRYISDEIARYIWRYTISASDIFISIAGSVGLVATVPVSLDGAYLTENAAKICIDDPSVLDTTYLLAVLRSGALADQIAKHKGVGGGVPKLALFRIEDLDIPVPDISVQTEIGETYRSLRAGVEAARAAVGQMEATRKEVMSGLLSGHVRVPA